MTTIVAVEKANSIAIAYDNVTGVGSVATVNAIRQSKVNKYGDTYIGVAGLSVYNNLLSHYLKRNELPKLCDEDSILQFFLDFWKELHDNYHFVDDQSVEDHPSPFADLDAEFIVVNQTGMYRIKEILSVNKFEKFFAIGSGASHAEGALSVLYSTDMNAVDIARESVRIAIEFDRGSGGGIESVELQLE